MCDDDDEEDDDNDDEQRYKTVISFLKYSVTTCTACFNVTNFTFYPYLAFTCII
jgi:hypothetical protein